MKIDNFYDIIKNLPENESKEFFISQLIQNLANLPEFPLIKFKNIFNYCFDLLNTISTNILNHIKILPKKFIIYFIKNQKNINCS